MQHFCCGQPQPGVFPPCSARPISICDGSPLNFRAGFQAAGNPLPVLPVETGLSVLHYRASDQATAVGVVPGAGRAVTVTVTYSAGLN